MKVNWKAADETYQMLFGEPLDRKVCQAEIDRYDDGTRDDDEVIECLERDGDPENCVGLSRGQLDCIIYNLEE